MTYDYRADVEDPTDCDGQRFQLFDLAVNPEPWKVPPMSAARGKGGKGLYVRAGVDLAGKNYKDAIAEEIRGYEYYMMEPPYEIELWFWRNLSGGRNVVDVTNMQKLTEDALQDLVINNDVNVRDTHSHNMGQGAEIEGRVVILVTETKREPFFNDTWLEENESLKHKKTDWNNLTQGIQQESVGNYNVWPPPQTGNILK